MTWKKCARCGKDFLQLPGHIYKLPGNSKHKVLIYCSYTCYRKGCAEWNYEPRNNFAGRKS